MILYCVRHAESVYNDERRIQGQADPPLSPVGQKQALALLPAFEPLDIEAIFSSPLRRAYDTARPLAQALGLDIETDDRLKELDVGVFQSKRWEEIQAEFPEAAAKWKSRDPDFIIPGGESRRQLMARSQAALETIRQTLQSRSQRQAILVAHGGALTAGLKALLGVPAQRNPFSLYNASISQLRWLGDSPDAVRLVTLNEIEHLRRAGCDTRGGDL